MGHDSMTWRAIAVIRDLVDLKTALVALFLSITIWCLASAWFVSLRYLRDIPGPSLAAYTRLWYLKALASGKSSDVLVEVNEKYGSLARIGPKLLLTSDPQIWQQILSIQSNYQRGPWFDCLRLDPNRADLITERDTGRHNLLRKQMANAYSGKGVDGFTASIDDNLLEWLGYLKQHAVSSSQRFVNFDMARSIQWLDFDMVCRLFFGYPFGFIREHQDQYEFQEMLEERLPIVEKLGVLLEVNKLIRAIDRTPLLRRILPSVTDKSGIGRIRGLARQTVDARFGEDRKMKNDILGTWLSKGLHREQAETEMVIALFAGSDTTATAIRGILLHVLSNPLSYVKLCDEIRSAEAAGQLSKPIVRIEEATSLPYLQACIKEGLRVFPPVTAMRERMVPENGDYIDGHFVPAGVSIGVNLRGLLANEQTFAPDPKIFRPERWLEASPDQLRDMDRVHELVFNWGLTRCLGISLAHIMMNKVLVELFRRWEMTLTSPQKPWTSVCYGVFQQKNFFLRLTKAKSSLDPHLDI